MIRAELAIAVVPVLLFLVSLVYLDSYKLVRPVTIGGAIVAGGFAAGGSYLVNVGLVSATQIEPWVISRFLAPPVEELFKGVFIIHLVRSKRVGFPVDSAIYGFAVGAGFAMVENLHYLYSLPDSSTYVWIIRGFGTATLHGGTTAILGILSSTLNDRKQGPFATFLPGLVLAILLHSLFNHFYVSPLVSTVVILVCFPLFLVVAFGQSERMLREWLDLGFDSEVELLELINSGGLSETRIGHYLNELRNRFPGEIVADVLCYVRLYLELSLRAKGILLAREAGFRITREPEVTEKLEELKYLERGIGSTGKLALLPLLRTGSRDLWQVYLVETS